MNRVFVETAKADNVEIYHMDDKEINLETLLELSEKYKDLGVNLSVSRHGFHLFDFRHFREKELKIVQENFLIIMSGRTMFICRKNFRKNMKSTIYSRTISEIFLPPVLQFRDVFLSASRP